METSTKIHTSALASTELFEIASLGDATKLSLPQCDAIFEQFRATLLTLTANSDDNIHLYREFSLAAIELESTITEKKSRSQHALS